MPPVEGVSLFPHLSAYNRWTSPGDGHTDPVGAAERRDDLDEATGIDGHSMAMCADRGHAMAQKRHAKPLRLSGIVNHARHLLS